MRVRDMTRGSAIRLILSTALPLMLGNAFQQLYTVVDASVVGKGVGMADKHHAVVPIFACLQELIRQSLDGALSAANLDGADEVTFCIHLQHRLDVQHGTHHRRCGAHTATPL